MTAQTVISAVFLLIGVVSGAIILTHSFRDKASFQAEEGRFSIACAIQTLIFFLSPAGFPDFLFNTLFFRRFHLVDNKRFPDSLLGCSMVPSFIMAFFFMQSKLTVPWSTLIPCAISIAIGAFTGSRVVGILDGGKIKKALGYALIGSLVALVIRIIIARGAAGTAVSLSGYKLVIATIYSFFWGAVSMLGVPTKPASTAVLLLLGLSPLSTLTMIIVLSCFGAFTGGTQVLKRGQYQKKTCSAAVIFGSLGAVLGSLFTISISAPVLNIILLVVLLIAIISTFRS